MRDRSVNEEVAMKDDTLAAGAFGKRYSEAIRRPSKPRLGHDGNEARGSRLAMKTLSDQVVRDGEEESEAEVQLAFTCPSCGETNKVNLPEGWTVAEGEEEEEAEGRGQRLRTKCSKCGETYSVEPPDGTHFGRRKAAGEAARAFARDYGRAIEASRLRHGALRIL